MTFAYSFFDPIGIVEGTLVKQEHPMIYSRSISSWLENFGKGIDIFSLNLPARIFNHRSY